MSFSKARIQRFNEVQDCTPSPSKYNVAIQERIKLGIIAPKSENVVIRENSEVSSVRSTPCFQTPTLPLKRKKILGLSFKAPKYELKLSDKEQLRNKLVECNNKDLYIRDLTDQIEDLNLVVCNLRKDRDGLEVSKRDVEVELSSLQKRHNQQSLKMRESIKVIHYELNHIKSATTDLKQENLSTLKSILECVSKFKELYDAACEEMKQAHLEETAPLEAKIIILEDKLKDSKMLAEIQAEEMNKWKQRIEDKEMEADDAACEEMKQTHLKETAPLEAKIMILEDKLKDSKILAEIQAEEVNKWKQRVEDKEKEAEAILKECQAISEYNIIQSEVEKNQMKNKFEEKIKEYEQEIGVVGVEKRAYELSIATFQDTNEVLKKRLIESDRDVVQLKEELDKSEEKTLALEANLTELRNQLKESQSANEELEMQYESTCKLMQQEVSSKQKELLLKLDELKGKVHKEQGVMKEYVDQYIQQHKLVESKDSMLKSEVKSLKVELDSTKARNQQLEELIGPFQQRLEDYQAELQQLNSKQLMQHEELFANNLDLEAKNLKLSKTVEKLIAENEELRKMKRTKYVKENKENVGSPKCVKNVQSPVPLKDKN